MFRAYSGDETVVQVVRPGLRIPLLVTDAREQSPDGADRTVAAALAEESGRGYDLAEGPLFTPRLIRLADDDQVLVLGMHHIVTDAHSAGLLTSDLEELYRAAVENRAPVCTACRHDGRCTGTGPGPGRSGVVAGAVG